MHTRWLAVCALQGPAASCDRTPPRPPGARVRRPLSVARACGVREQELEDVLADIVLVDFGMAATFTPGELYLTGCSTRLEYASPEMLLWRKGKVPGTLCLGASGNAGLRAGVHRSLQQAPPPPPCTGILGSLFCPVHRPFHWALRTATQKSLILGTRSSLFRLPFVSAMYATRGMPKLLIFWLWLLAFWQR